MFAECIFLGTQQTSSLPSDALKTLGKKKTLGKEEVCRVSKKTLGKEGFAFFALGKEVKSFF